MLFFGNTLQQWLLLVLFILVSFMVAKIVRWFLEAVVKKNIVSKTENEIDDIIFYAIDKPIVFVISWIGIWLALHTLTIEAGLQEKIYKGSEVLVILSVAWIISRALEAVINYSLKKMPGTTNVMIGVLINILQTTRGILVWGLAITLALNHIGYNIGALLTGVGIGGLAFAMAAKDTVANLFGGGTIIATRPFTIGDRIRISGVDGWVSSIGLRATIVKDFYGREHIIPNKVFIDEIVENVDKEKVYYEVEHLHLQKDTRVEQMQLAIQLLKKIIEENKLFENGCWITFDKIGIYALDIEFWYAIKKWNISDQPDYSDWYQKKSIAKTQLHIKIMQEFEKNNLKFAFTNTICLSEKAL